MSNLFIIKSTAPHLLDISKQEVKNSNHASMNGSKTAMELETSLWMETLVYK